MCRDSPIYKSRKHFGNLSKQDVALPDKGLLEAQEEEQKPQEHLARSIIPRSVLPLTLRKADEGKVAKSVGTVAPGR